MERTFAFHFLGCKTNQSDALSYAGFLQKAGWREASAGECPTLVFVQTCTVTMSADAQGRQLARKLKRENPTSKIMMTGCYAQRAEQQIAAMPEVDYVIGNLNPKKWELLSRIAGQTQTPEFLDFPMPAAFARTRPYIKIQEGCDARCSYCIIPAVRGKSRSLPPDVVIKRVEMYRDLGYREMIFTGISMGGYGKDLSPRTTLSSLMKRLDQLEGEFKIRLSSIEPEEIGDEFVEVFCGSARFQPHLHLPLQSASDVVLKLMRRQYLFHKYDRIAGQLFANKPDLNLGTDLLVGFPGEDKEAFAQTYRYVEQAPFAYCHVFPFSPRPGTPAASYRRAGSESEIKDRAAQLRSLSAEKNLNYRRHFVGKILGALLLHGTQEALTDNYIRVKLAHPIDSDKIALRIDTVDDHDTYGTAMIKPEWPRIETTYSRHTTRQVVI